MERRGEEGGGEEGGGEEGGGEEGGGEEGERREGKGGEGEPRGGKAPLPFPYDLRDKSRGEPHDRDATKVPDFPSPLPPQHKPRPLPCRRRLVGGAARTGRGLNRLFPLVPLGKVL